ncbi:DNA-binding domain-containing protein [Crocosphaera sp. XPORK-15E]|uniref:DNA-binding domain-containing protein n=1 Tax=Crocosphaera sp. XPORK-15E TaxID=3110247 RepID=UPI002B1F3252|nr:DNA-binding domain-containing protein [Crocosphaera sp. XPORK-15E]MEA5537015.1 DNA-binding domain-containing protein [Crocosphaera sp. XPORK-15E]
MASVRISARLPVDLYQRLEDYMTTNKLSQTEAIIAAIATYFGEGDNVPLAERVSKLEKRLEVLER